MTASATGESRLKREMRERRERKLSRIVGANGGRIDRKVAVHEAGHAVGRFLTAGTLGYDSEDAITHIDVHGAPISGQPKISVDGTHVLYSQATTFGPMFSRPIEEFLMSHILSEEPDGREVPMGEVAGLLTKARAAGFDVDDWFLAKALSTILGPMAEAKFLGKPLYSLFNDHSAEEDMISIAKEGRLAGLTPEEIEEAVEKTTDIARQHIEREEVWRAIMALADRLKPGRMSGRTAVAIIASEIGATRPA